jgi:rRNA maturation endonuclease Nob1
MTDPEDPRERRLQCVDCWRIWSALDEHADAEQTRCPVCGGPLATYVPPAWPGAERERER